MNSDSTANLQELLNSVRQYAQYLSELGVEGIELKAEIFGASTATTHAPLITRSAEVNIRSAPQKDQLIAPATSSQKPVQTDRAEESGALFSDLNSVSVQSSETLEDVWREIGDCTRCGLCEGRTQVVNTFGNPKARLMFVGEAPGADEDTQGRPFVGRAGQLLTKIIEAIGMKRDEVLIGNVNRCRPPGNRQPTLEEAAICRPFLFREIAAVQPQVIVVLGNTALRNLLEVREGITRVRGKFQDFRGIKVMPTFHPAYLLRDPSKKKETWEDLKRVRDYLQGMPSE